MCEIGNSYFLPNMQLLNLFKDNLRENDKSEITIKNYVSDVRRFLEWLEERKGTLEPFTLSASEIQTYKNKLTSQLDPASFKRHLSSLNQFLYFLVKINVLTSTESLTSSTENKEDEFERTLKFNEFKLFLRENQASDLTVKNYLSDVKQFMHWLKEASSQQNSLIDESILLSRINRDVLRIFRSRLISERQLSPISVNRKLSSIRNYIKFLSKIGILPDYEHEIPNVEEKKELLDASTYQALLSSTLSNESVKALTPESYSTIPPVRLLQKMRKILVYILDISLITPLSEVVLGCQKILWFISGGRIFYKAHKKPMKRTMLDRLIVDNLHSDYLAPIPGFQSTLPLHRRFYLLARYSRPEWYKRYHTYSIAHYLHVGVLGVLIVLMGSFLYQRAFPSASQRVLGTQISANGRQLQFRGTLLDSRSMPITHNTPVRFSLYDDRIASGSSLLWQEVLEVTPDNQGNFSVSLGNYPPIPNELFTQGKGVFLGIAVSSESELKPRQAIPNIQLAANADRLGGFQPITNEGAGSKNVILALDSAGNLTIGKGSPTFQASNGNFTLRAQSLVLSTLSKSNGNITLSPDGTGVIDITKPLQNTSDYGVTPETIGAVEVADAFAIIATESGRSALTINQNGSGALISASGSGIAKFGIDNTGSGYFAGNITLDGTDLSTNQYAINVFNRNARIINLGGEAIAVTIGSQSGTTTLRTPTTNIEGNVTIGGKTGTIYSAENAGITFSGSGNHILTAQSGVLQVGSQLELAKDVTIMPRGAEGTNNLGSSNNPFDTLYVNNIVNSSLNGQANVFVVENNAIHSLNNSNDIIIGGSATSSAGWQVFGSGINKGTASSSGNLTFTGIKTTVNQLNGGSLTFQTSPGGESSAIPQLTIANSGIGIGNTSPLFRLDVQDTRSATATAMLTNLSSDSNAGVLALKLGTPLPQMSNYFTTFLNSNGEVVGKISGNGANGVVYSSSGSDFAEYFLKHDSHEAFAAGSIVCLHPEGGVTKCTQETTSIVGVVSDRPALVGNASKEHDDSYVLVGLQGQVPVLVSDENGPIQSADSLTFSSTPGVAAKAVGPSPIVGKALGEKSKDDSRVNTYIKPGWYDPSPKILSDAGDLQLYLQNSVHESGSANYNVVSSKNRNVLERLGAFSDSIIGNLIVGFVKAEEFTAKQAYLSQKLVANLIDARELSVQKRIDAPLAAIETINTRVISPLSDKDGLALVFEKDKVQLINPVSSKTAATIDKEGNASFSGQLASRDLNVSEDATISGTLHVGRLVAGEIVGAASPSATYITTITNIYQTSQASTSPTINPTPFPTPPSLFANNNTITNSEHSPPETSSLLSPRITNSYADISSFSGVLRQKAFETEFATIQSGLMVFGPASFDDISAAGQIAVGGNLILASNAINTLGNDLELQSLRQGNLLVMGGLVKIDTEGNLTVKGNAEFARDVLVKGTLKTNLLAPVPDSDLVVKLHDEANKNTSPPSSFVIADGSGSAKFRVSDIGDIVASGSAKFMKLMTNNLNLVRGAQADTSVTQTIASSSAGTATITKGQKERTIVSPYVTEDSLIYLTPTSDTYGVTPYVARQTAEDPDKNSTGSFTIQITRPVLGNIDLNWWIIN